MFKFLKEKLSGVFNKINKKVEEEVPTEEKESLQEKPVVKQSKKIKEKKKKKNEVFVEQPTLPVEIEKIESPSEVKATEPVVPREKSGFISRLFKKKPSEEKVIEIKPPVLQQESEKKGFFASVKEKILTQKISADKFEELFFELEIVLLENNVAVEVIDKMKADLKIKLVEQPIPRGKIIEVLRTTLRQSVQDILSVPSFDVVQRIREKKSKPFVIVFVGVNGAGKTTTIAKFAHFLQKQKLTCLLAAADTWRSAAIQQLEEHGNKLGVRVIKHDYGSDPAAVAFDGIKAAQAKNIDVVLIDTAGRQQSNVNLMKEMEKIIRVAQPDLKLFIGESITGNDCVTQAQEFNKYVHLDGFILTKADVDEKGGTALSISYVLQKPLLYLGFGQSYDDLKPFDKEFIISQLGL